MLDDSAGDRQVEQCLATPKDQQSIARLLDIGDDVRRQEGGRAIFADGIHEHMQELASGEWVQTRQRFVEEEDRRPRPQRERQSDLRLLSPRQLVGAGGRRDIEIGEAPTGIWGVKGRPKGAGHDHVIVYGQLAIEGRGLGHVADAREGPTPIAPRIDAVDDDAALGRAFETDP